MVFWLAFLAILLVTSAFFSGAETALFALTRHELHRFQADPRASRRLAASLMQQPRQLLLTLMVGNVTVNMLIFATSLTLFKKLTGPGSLLGPLLGLSSPIVVTLLGEIFPKGTAIDLRTSLAPKMAPIVHGCQILLAPVTTTLNVLLVEPLTRLLAGDTKPPPDVTAEELQELIEMSQARQIIDADENAMLSGVIRLNELKVRNILIPRVDMIAFDIDDDPEELRQLLREHHMPKIPVYKEDVDHTLGLIYAKDLFLFPTQPLQQLVKPASFVPEVITLTQLIDFFRKTQSQLAMVVDEHGGVVGLVTIEDVAERIVGALALPGDESDLPTWERLDDRHYSISGQVNIREWAEHFNIRQFDERVTTLAGLMMASLGRVPKVGDQVRLGNLLLTVESLNGRRIERIHLELLSGQRFQGPAAALHE